MLIIKNLIITRGIHFIILLLFSFFMPLAKMKGNEQMKEAVIKLDGIGDFAPQSIAVRVLGTAYVFDKKFPDLFVINDRWYPACTLYEYIDHDQSEIPIFEKRCNIPLPFDVGKQRPSSIVEKGGEIYLFWLDNDKLKYALYNSEKYCFDNQGYLSLPILVNDISTMTVEMSDKGSIKVLFSSIGQKGTAPPGNRRGADYFPYSGEGIWRGSFSYDGIYSIEYKGLTDCAPNKINMLSQSDSEVLGGCQSITAVKYNDHGEEGIISGTHMGAIYFFKWKNGKLQLEKKKHLVAIDLNAIRHPTIWPTPIVYPNLKGEFTDLIVAGEGGVYYYCFTGSFSSEGKPIYESPVSLKERSPNLYTGTLIVPNVVDWDYDGVLDIICGNSTGKIVFCKNVGTNKFPSYLPAIPLKANNLEIHIQPDYGEAIQGPGEARWGYASPNVFDWNGDGFLDILTNDSRSRHTVFINRGNDKLSEGIPLYLDDLALRGTWRCRPGIGKMGNRLVYVTLDNDDDIHLYYRIDDYNVEEGFKLRLVDGNVINANKIRAGGTGRLKFEIVDWDGDGVKDLLLGTNKHHTIPNPETGIPWNNNKEQKGATVIFMKNVGSNHIPKYDYPKQLRYKGEYIKLGQHACSITCAFLGEINNDLPNLIVGDEKGVLYLLNRNDLTW